MTFAGRATTLSALVCVLVPPSVPEPAIVDLFSPAARSQLAKGRPVTELLAEDGIDIAIAAAVRANVDAQRFVVQFREVEQLMKGGFVESSGRLSAQPRVEDLAGLSLDDDDLDDLRGCRPGRCRVKLSAPEITRVQAAVKGAGERWKPAALSAFKTLLVERALAYRARGLAALEPYEELPEGHQPKFVTARMLDLLERRGVARSETLRYLRGYPAVGPDAESFLYWSKDRLNDAKPVVSITHAVIMPGGSGSPEAVMLQVYASHYMNAAVSLTTLVSAPSQPPSLAYLRLSTVDVFDGAFGGIVRRLVNRRIRSDGPRAIDAIRRKLEGSDR